MILLYMMLANANKVSAVIYIWNKMTFYLPFFHNEIL